ncbi:MAG: methyltransferase domain-containing protein [Nitrospirae bacterium]|nr:methyltransferase domain-containing protein [Nitrospirota bacterium]
MIKTDFVSYRTPSGQTIIAACDHIPPADKKRPFIIIPSAFGETKCDSVGLSYFLAMNGFDVLRYDGTSHPGESDGDMYDFTLSGGKKDLIASIDFVSKTFHPPTIGIVAKSLSWRYSLKAATEDRRIKYLLGIGGIVNLQATLKSIYREDLVDLVKRGKFKKKKFSDIFGYQISVNFMEDAITNNYHSIRSTLNDFRKLRIPTGYFFADNDAWVEIEDVKKVMSSGHAISGLHIIRNVLHQINENPLGALCIFRQTVTSCKQYLNKERIDHKDVIKPPLSVEAAQKRLEKKRLRTCEIIKEQESLFWKKYLTKYSFIDHIPDFRAYMEDVINIFGGIGKEDIVLDLGCGPGFFGTWIMEKNIDNFPTYIGVDIVDAVLQSAKKGHADILKKMGKHEYLNKLHYLSGDVDFSKRQHHNGTYICFKEGVADKICCSLLISYLQSPSLLLKECFRILKPGGILVVSSLKPYADLSLIYRNFVSQIRKKADIEKAKKLLSSAGMIRIKESQGHYRFYSEKQIALLLRKAGFKNIRCIRSFGNQANLAVAIK